MHVFFKLIAHITSAKFNLSEDESATCFFRSCCIIYLCSQPFQVSTGLVPELMIMQIEYLALGPFKFQLGLSRNLR